MAGQIYNMIQKIVTQKARGNAIIANSVRTKMLLKGIAVDKYTPTSPDDPVIAKKLQDIAKEFGILL